MPGRKMNAPHGSLHFSASHFSAFYCLSPLEMLLQEKCLDIRMWGYFGDVTGSPAGTYYYERAEQTMYFWNIFDQVLLRPDLLPYFRSEDLQILTGDGRSSFLSAKGLPDNSIASDHLPVLFKLHLVERSEYGSASS
jgi:hypothetical protein